MTELDDLEHNMRGTVAGPWLKPIASYPITCRCGQLNCDTGDEVLLKVGDHLFVGFREMGTWLARDPADPEAYCDLMGEPTHWAPLGLSWNRDAGEHEPFRWPLEAGLPD